MTCIRQVERPKWKWTLAHVYDACGCVYAVVNARVLPVYFHAYIYIAALYCTCKHGGKLWRCDGHSH